VEDPDLLEAPRSRRPGSLFIPYDAIAAATTSVRRLRRDMFGMPLSLLGLTVVVGVFGGVLGAAYLLVIHLLQHVLWPTHWSGAIGFLVLGGVGVVVALLNRLLGSPGNVELLVDNIHVSGGPSSVRALRSLVPTSLLTIAAGGAAGPEAPLVTTSGTLAAWLARTRRAAVDETRILTIAGMAAAFTVLFGAPLGSSLFALEILHRRGLQYHEALVPAIVGSLSGYGIYTLLVHADLAPIWSIARAGGANELRPVDLALAVGAGIAGAAVAVVFTYATVWSRRLFERLPRWARPVLGGLVLAALGWWSPYALTFGEAQTGHIVSAHLLAGALAIAALAKFCGTAVTVSSGWPGGFIIPLFFMGATLGQLGDIWVPGAHGAVLAAALMVAINVGVTKTLLGSTLVVTEMGGLHLMPSTLLAGAIAFMLTSNVGLIESQRERSEESTDANDDDRDDGNGAGALATA
jgi:H+/Cl- antiporter ClcA